MKKYQRRPDQVKAHLKLQSDGGVYTDVSMRIHIPERYATRHLASIGTETFILGFFALIMDNGDYAVSTTPAMMRITPSSTETIMIGDTSYFEFHFDAGDRVFHSTHLVKNKALTYYIYDEHIAKGRIPWYMNYFDMATMFELAEKHAGLYLGSRAILNLITSTTARDSKDLKTLYRHVIFKPVDVLNNPPAIVPFRSVIWNTSDTTSKLVGAHFSDSINSALANPSERVERIEELLRT